MAWLKSLHSIRLFALGLFLAGLLGVFGARYLEPEPPPPWLTYESPIQVEAKTINVGGNLVFMIKSCNNTANPLNNLGSFIWVRLDVSPPLLVTQQSQANTHPPGCLSRRVSVPIIPGVIPGSWRYEGHVCPVIDTKQCANFQTEPFTVLP